MRVLITGINGQLGYDLLQVGQTLKTEHALEIVGVGRKEMDITNAHQVYQLVTQVKPDLILHAAAYTKVDLAEGEGKEEAYAVNAYGTRNLVQAANLLGATFLYVSTDYVFDGTKGSPYHEWDTVNPINEYGRSKLAGEQYVRMLSDKHYIVRTSWVYGENGQNFVKTMLHLAHKQLKENPNQKANLHVVSDQIGSPTYTGDLAQALWNHVLQNVDKPFIETGTYHMTGSGSCSWYEFAKVIFDEAGLTEKVAVEPIPTSAFPRPAQRPAYSVLESVQNVVTSYMPLPSWRQAIGQHMRDHILGNIRKD